MSFEGDGEALENSVSLPLFTQVPDVNSEELHCCQQNPELFICI